MPNANNKQIAGDHYQKGKDFQHWDLAIRYGNRYLESCISKYVTRWRDKNGIKDLEKAVHYFEKLMEAVDAGLIEPVTIDVADRSLETFLAYAKSYGIDKLQISIVYTLHTWTGRNELFSAKRMLDTYVNIQRDNLESGDDLKGYVKQ